MPSSYSFKPDLFSAGLLHSRLLFYLFTKTSFLYDCQPKWQRRSLWRVLVETYLSPNSTKCHGGLPRTAGTAWATDGKVRTNFDDADL